MAIPKTRILDGTMVKYVDVQGGNNVQSFIVQNVSDQLAGFINTATLLGNPLTKNVLTYGGNKTAYAYPQTNYVKPPGIFDEMYFLGNSDSQEYQTDQGPQFFYGRGEATDASVVSRLRIGDELVGYAWPPLGAPRRKTATYDLNHGPMSNLGRTGVIDYILSKP